MISLSKDEARLYNYMMEVIDQVMDNYGYDYVIGKNISKKYYTNNLENINVFNECDSILEKAELISLGYYLFKRLGLEDVELSINKNDELVLIDYKTDYVPEGQEFTLVEKYKKQLELYKVALEQSVKRKVDKMAIYSLYLNKLIEMK